MNVSLNFLFSRFYRCVKFNQYENDFTIFEYACPNGLVFDDRWEVCVWPAQVKKIIGILLLTEMQLGIFFFIQATPCDGSSEIMPVPKQDYSCPAEGYFVDPENCRCDKTILIKDTLEFPYEMYEFLP